MPERTDFGLPFPRVAGYPLASMIPAKHRVRAAQIGAVLLLSSLAFGATLALAAAPTPEEEVAALEHDDAHKSLLTEPLAHAKDALARAATLRKTGDETRARLADGLVMEWVATAHDLVRASEAERAAASARTGAVDAGNAAERERALLEEGIAQNGRLRAQVEEVTRDAKGGPSRTALPARVTIPPSAKSDAGVTAAHDGGSR